MHWLILKWQNDYGAYICQVSQLNLQVGVGGLGLRSHSHSDDLGVHNCVVPELKTEIHFHFSLLLSNPWFILIQGQTLIGI